MFSTEVVHEKLGSVKNLRSMPLAATNRFYQLAKSMTGDDIKALAMREVTGEHKETHKYENEGRPPPRRLGQARLQQRQHQKER